MQVKKTVLAALFAALLVICGWLAVPVGEMAVTMQTFGVFLTLCVLGGKTGTFGILGYLLLGAVGLPVFSGFRGGLGALLGATGGYLVGFLAIGLVYWLSERLLPSARWTDAVACAAGLLVCYGFGTAWFWAVYLPDGGVGIGAVLLKCVAPYLLPDALKLALAVYIAPRLRRLYQKICS